MNYFIDQKSLKKNNSKIKLFIKLLKENKQYLLDMATFATQTSTHYHEEDLEFAIKSISKIYLPKMNDQSFFLRPKGKILIGLSANEPFIVGIIPVLSALLVNNQVNVRAASINKDLEKYIIDLLYKSGFSQNEIQLLDLPKEKIQGILSKYDYIFWFGSYKTCKELSINCLDAGVDYNVESEGNDIAILDGTLNEFQIKQSIALILKSIKRHNGQTCQSIRGVMVEKTIFKKFKKMIELLLKADKDNDSLQKKPMVNFIKTVNFEEVSFESKLWIMEYEDNDDLKEMINENPYRLTLNIFSNKKLLQILEDFSFYKSSRLLINCNPIVVEINEPWGGIGRSGSFGISSWIEKFTDKTYLKYEEKIK